jgi:hypothetical protein
MGEQARVFPAIATDVRALADSEARPPPLLRAACRSWDIQRFLAEVYRIEVSAAPISEVTGARRREMLERPIK